MSVERSRAKFSRRRHPADGGLLVDGRRITRLPPLGVAALAFFVLGLVSTFAGLCLVLGELRVSLEVIEFEHDNLIRLRRGEGLLPSGLAR